MKKLIKGRTIFNVINTCIMLAIIIVTAYPFYYVVVASFSDPDRLSSFTGVLLAPLGPFTVRAYEVVFENPLITSGFLNTLFVLVVGVTVNMCLTILGAYFLTLKGPMFKDVIAMIIVFTMYFSGGLIPSYLNVKELGLLNSLWSLILPGAISTTNLIIMKSGFQSIPDSLVESARLDGASYIQVLLKIMIPLSKATIAVLVLYYGVEHWNAWFNASIYLQDSDKFPIQLVLHKILSNTSMTEIDESATYLELMKYALIVVTSAPIIALYPFIQKYFTKGVMVGAVKG